MPPVIDIASWDAFENTVRDLVIVISPAPRPRGVLVIEDLVYIATDGQPIRLLGSDRIVRLVMKARTTIVAEAHEHIVRETLVPVVSINQTVDGAREDDLQAA